MITCALLLWMTYIYTVIAIYNAKVLHSYMNLNAYDHIMYTVHHKYYQSKYQSFHAILVIQLIIQGVDVLK